MLEKKDVFLKYCNMNYLKLYIYIFFLLIGIAVGHVYYFLEDVCPNQPGGMRILKTPRFMLVLCSNLLIKFTFFQLVYFMILDLLQVKYLYILVK